MSASNNSKLVHGGDLSDAVIQFGVHSDEWLDLSTGINPVAYPNVDIDDANLKRLPQKSITDEVLKAACIFYDVAPKASFTAAPGTQAILQVLPGLWDPSDIAIIVPTYEEHTQTWRASGHQVRMCSQLEDVVNEQVVVVVNPNNPDGRRYAPEVLIKIATDLSAKGGVLVVDQAFTDPTPELSLSPYADMPGLVLLYSFGKFFGLAGLRLGFASGPHNIISKLKQKLGPWAVSGPALEIGARAYADQDWIRKTRIRLSRDRTRLENVLTDNEFEIIGGTDLYCLGGHNQASKVFHTLGQAGILVRTFPNYPNWLRFGLPGNDAGFDRLAMALGSLSSE
jgi:cobalamin biosynthetic protein CobC